jgi:pyruvate formate lyase activating enzyme
MVWFEYVMDTARLIKSEGYKNVLVSNGYIEKEPLQELLPVIDAINIDLKAFTEENYRRIGGKLAPVLDTITAFKNSGVHVELTTLIVTGLNDKEAELKNLIRWIAKLDSSIPLHLSRYFPQYRYHEAPTDEGFMHKIEELASAELDYVYLGNVHEQTNTLCPGCGAVLIRRMGYSVEITGIHGNNCSTCGRKADIIFS